MLMAGKRKNMLYCLEISVAFQSMEERKVEYETNEELESMPAVFAPMGEIAGYPVRPGLFHLNGAMALPEGVNFTVHTHEGTGCELLLFHRERGRALCGAAFPGGIPGWGCVRHDCFRPGYRGI